MGRLAVLFVAIVALQSWVNISNADIHAHSHDTEPPHFKYSKEVNEQAAREAAQVKTGGEQHEHGHSHDHHGHSHEHYHHEDEDDYDHGHSHEHHGDFHEAHGHSHEDHGHSHENFGHAHEDHGHSHDDHGHSHEHHVHSHDDHGHSREDHGHSHDDHGHSHEDHGHSHDDHGHSHDDHGHSHEDHGHFHEASDHTDEHHGHSHGPEGGCPHSHSHEPPQKRETVKTGGDASRKQAQWKPQSSALPYDPNGLLWFLNNARIRLWVYSIGSTLIISIAPFVILSIIPVQGNTAENEPLLKVLLSFGSGGLLGDAFLHLIPHAQPAGGEHSHSHSHSHSEGHSHGPHDMSVGGYVLAGIIVFLTVEKLVRIFRGEEEHGHGHSHGASHEHSVQKAATETKAKNDVKAKKSDESSSAEESSVDDNDENEKGALVEKHEKDVVSFKVAAYLNMAADFAHNFTDGLAIGASYLAGSTIGVVTMITVLVHEVPHEIGDFAILVQSGFSKKRAMLVQLLTAFGALTGCVLSLWTADVYLADAASASWVLPFTAGGFIYIATVSVIPELLENSSAWQSIKEIVALLTGIYLMYLIAVFE